MARLVLVGNAPSSGSTLLADLLDSTKTTACGPELRLFASQRFYGFDKSRQAVLDPSPAASIYSSRNVVSKSNLRAYGLNLTELRSLVSDAEDVSSFLTAFATHYLSFRNKSLEGTVYEKTPQNIAVIGSYLESVPNGRFIHLVRNPLYVYRSLRQRGFSTFISLATWLIDIAAFLPHKDKLGVTLLRYEDLIADPYQIVADLIGSIDGEAYRADQIREGYEMNMYQQYNQRRIATWSVKKRGIIGDANRKTLSVEHRQDIAAVLRMRISPAYARRFGLSEISFQDAVRATGYEEAVINSISGLASKSERLRPSITDMLFLGRKALGGAFRREASVRQLLAHLNPLVVAH